MPALSKAQVEHATMRLEQHRAKYVQRMTAPLGEEPEVPEYTDEQKTAMIRSGEAKLKPKYAADTHAYTDVGNLFDFPKIGAMLAAEAAHAAWGAQVDAIRAEADRIYQSALDDLIMAPDGKAALDRIAAAFG
jgi:hypothetical protein